MPLTLAPTVSLESLAALLITGCLGLTFEQLATANGPRVEKERCKLVFLIYPPGSAQFTRNSP